MPNPLNESANWEPTVRQLELTDPATGGPDGLINVPARQLANRTGYLKGRLDDGRVVGGGATLPEATQADRRRLFVLEGAAGTPDRLYVCMKLGNDTYAWLELGL